MLMTFGGIWACQWRELRPISFGGLGGGVTSGGDNSNQAGSSQSQTPAGNDGGNDETPSISRGRGRGRNRDGGGEYEMVGMKEIPEEMV